MMECPKCGYDIFSEYEELLSNDTKESKNVKIVDVHPEYTFEAMNTYGWDVECKCPECGTEWDFSDCNY